MNQYVVAMIIGLIIGIIDIIPMILQKIPIQANVSAFLQYFFISFIVVFIDLPGIAWWAQGPIISLCMAIPVIIITAKEDSKSIFIIGSMSIILGLCISILKQLFI